MFRSIIKLQIVICISVTLSIFWGCKNNQSNTAKIFLDFSEEPVSIHEIGLINDVEILHLDYKKALFGEANKIIRHKDRIYLMDERKTRSVIVYDTLGQFINVISKYGQGPNEYIQLVDIFIDAEDNTLNLVSRMDRKILKFDLNGEQLLSVQKLPKSFWNVSKLKTGYVGYMANWSQDKDKPYNLWTMSQNLDLENSFLKIDKTWESKGLGGGSIFSAYQSSTHYIAPMDYNIYRIENDEVSIVYSFDLGKLAVKDKSYELIDKFRGDPAPPYIFRFYYFQETKNHLIVQVLYRGQYLFGVYNKQNAQTYIAKPEHYTGKYFFGFGNIVSFDENTIYTLVDASRIKPMWVGKDQYGNDFESKYPEQVKNLRKKFDHIDEEDNPYLVMYSIK